MEGQKLQDLHNFLDVLNHARTPDERITPERRERIRQFVEQFLSADWNSLPSWTKREMLRDVEQVLRLFENPRIVYP